MFFIDYKRDNGGVVLETRVKERDTPSSLKLSADGHSFYVGDLFGNSSEELFECEWKNNPRVLSEYCSALYIVSYGDNECSFAADISGRELLFYYYSQDRFVLSDSFWGILKRIQPSFSDLDREAIGEIITMGGGVPCDYITPIKGLKWLGANCSGSFNASSWKLTVRSFDDIRRSCEVHNIDEAVESFDADMTSMAHILGNRHPDAVFGLGLSGGLDSRIALHYLGKAGLDVVCFNVGKSKPHGLFFANSLKKARELADLANVGLTEVEWNPKTVRTKLDLMLRNQPLGTGGHYTNAYKYESEGRPLFDVLVTGGQAIGPMLVGVSVLDSSDEMSYESVISYLVHLATGEVRAYPYTENSIRKQLIQLGIGSLDINKGNNFELWNKIIGSTPYERIASKIRHFVDDCMGRGYTSSDITLDYRTRVLGPTGRNGAYESGLGTEKSYTIYTPFLIKDGLKWDASLLENRRILRELIAKKIPEFYRVGEETFGSLKRKRSKASLFAQKTVFALRGSGIMTDEWYFKHPVIRDSYLEDMTNSCEWFYELFPEAKDYAGILNMSPARMNSIWESKRLIDCIEDKRYLEFE